jgi:hypothetical protein
MSWGERGIARALARLPRRLRDDQLDGSEAQGVRFVVAVAHANEALAVAREELLGAVLSRLELEARLHGA